MTRCTGPDLRDFRQCRMAVGCEVGACYAEAHGEPDRCPLVARAIVASIADDPWEAREKTDAAFSPQALANSPRPPNDRNQGRSLADRIAEADARGGDILARANEAQERGDKAKAEKLYEQGQKWMDKSNRLRGCDWMRPPNDRGQGRKPIKPGQATVSMTIRLTAGQREKVAKLGGAAWVRKKIDGA